MMSVPSDVDRFASTVRQRSAEHAVAMPHMVEASILSVAASIIRQEVDSLVRVLYILSLDCSDRDTVIARFLQGTFCKPNGVTKITDKEMVEFATKLKGWPKVAYDFGNSFVHLSNLHAYDSRNPLASIEKSNRTEIIGYLSKYHGAPDDQNPDIYELLKMAAPVLEKITGNIDYYLEDLEARTPPDQVF